jgi:hypothetical protein
MDCIENQSIGGLYGTDSLEAKRLQIETLFERNKGIVNRWSIDGEKIGSSVEEIDGMWTSWQKKRTEWQGDSVSDGSEATSYTGKIRNYMQLKAIIDEKEKQFTQTQSIVHLLRELEKIHQGYEKVRDAKLDLHHLDALLEEWENEYWMPWLKIKSNGVDNSLLKISTAYSDAILTHKENWLLELKTRVDPLFELVKVGNQRKIQVSVNPAWTIHTLDLVQKLDQELSNDFFVEFMPKVLLKRWTNCLAKEILQYDVLYNASSEVILKGLNGTDTQDLNSAMVLEISKKGSLIPWAETSYMNLFHEIEQILCAFTLKGVLLSSGELYKIWVKEYIQDIIPMIYEMLFDQVLLDNPRHQLTHFMEPESPISTSISKLQKRISDMCNDKDTIVLYKAATFPSMRTWTINNFYKKIGRIVQLLILGPNQEPSPLTSGSLHAMTEAICPFKSCIMLDIEDLDSLPDGMDDIDAMSMCMYWLYNRSIGGMAPMLANIFESEMFFEKIYSVVQANDSDLDELGGFYSQLERYNPACYIQVSIQEVFFYLARMLRFYAIQLLASNDSEIDSGDIQYSFKNFLNAFSDSILAVCNYYASIIDTFNLEKDQPCWTDFPQLGSIFQASGYFLAHSILLYFLPRATWILQIVLPKVKSPAYDSSEDSKFTNDCLDIMNVWVTQATKLVSISDTALDLQIQAHKQFIQECLSEPYLSQERDLATLYNESSRTRVDQQLKKIRHHLLSIKKIYQVHGGSVKEDSTLASKSVYLRSIGQCLNLVLRYIIKAVLNMQDIAEEDTHHLHALTMTVGSWTRELFTWNFNSKKSSIDVIVYLLERRDSSNLMHLTCADESYLLEKKLEMQMAFLPDWIAFQHLSFLLEWSIKDIVDVQTSLKNSPICPFSLQNDQVIRLVKLIFDASEQREHFIDSIIELK